jgi:hypothetical protein
VNHADGHSLTVLSTLSVKTGQPNRDQMQGQHPDLPELIERGLFSHQSADVGPRSPVPNAEITAVRYAITCLATIEWGVIIRLHQLQLPRTDSDGMSHA